jgi:hypothetical protein
MNYSSCRHPLDATTLTANFESEYMSFYLMKTNLTSFLSLVNCPRHLSSTTCHIILTLSFNLSSKISMSSPTSFQSQQQAMSTTLQTCVLLGHMLARHPNDRLHTADPIINSTRSSFSLDTPILLLPSPHLSNSHPWKTCSM